jgi:hypothetical protein
MPMLREIHEQPEWVRLALFGLSCLIMLSFVGYFWLTSVERRFILALDPGEEGQARVAELERERPDPLGVLGARVGSAVAAIGNVMGFDQDAGFDSGEGNGNNHDRTYLLPLSD